MEQNQTTIDTRVGQQKMYLCSDVKIVPGPNAVVLDLHKAQSGHLMLPITEYNRKVTKHALNFLQTDLGQGAGQAAGQPEPEDVPEDFWSKDPWEEEAALEKMYEEDFAQFNGKTSKTSSGRL